MGSALQAQNTKEDNSHFVYPTFGSIVKDDQKLCAGENGPVGEAVLRNTKKER